MRRKDREILEIKKIASVLEHTSVVRLGLCDENQPYVIPMNFGFEVLEDSVVFYFHCAKEGRKLEIIKNNPKVCIEADILHKIVEGEHPQEWTAHYESVIAEGEIEIVDHLCDKLKAFEQIMLKAGYTKTLELSEKVLSAVTVLKVRADKIVGKSNVPH